MAQPDLSPAAGRLAWALTDHQGSVVGMYETRAERGSNLAWLAYDAHGTYFTLANSNGVGSLTSSGYTGREFDLFVGAYWNRARVYLPHAGRFANPDPLGFAAGDTNLYRYAFNSPTHFTDPSGKVAFLPFLLWGGGLMLAGASASRVAEYEYNRSSEFLAQPGWDPANMQQAAGLANSAAGWQLAGGILGLTGTAVAAAPLSGWAIGGWAPLVGWGGAVGMVGVGEKLAWDYGLYKAGAADAPWTAYHQHPVRSAIETGISIGTAGLFNGGLSRLTRKFFLRPTRHGARYTIGCPQFARGCGPKGNRPR